MRFHRLAPLALFPVLGFAEDLVIDDFEAEGFEGWTVEGEAFGEGPARGTLPNQMEVSGYEGRGHASSYHGGDDSTGRLRSRAFRIERRHLNFLIGGGAYPGETCLNLVSPEGEVLRTATGPNTRPGGSETLEWRSWDVSDLDGRELRLEVVDRRRGGWGHITVDAIRLSDLPAVVEVERSWKVEGRYLAWPVTRDKTASRRFVMTLDGEPFTYANIALSGDPDFWVFSDLADHRGKTLTVSARLPRELREAWEQVSLSDRYPGEESVHREDRRPHYHFTSRRGWINDPNGLVYHDGTWHLCYQHNPYNIFWDNMTWGHAVSDDLFHWEELPPALVPGPQGVMYSGSGFVVPAKRSALPVGDREALGIAYTAWGELALEPGQRATQGVAYSVDGGRTFSKFDGNPVLEHLVGGNRDPKVFWYEPTAKWVMTLYHDRDEYGIHVSPDLVSWKQASTYRIPGDSECPDLFELAIDGDPQRTKWVVWGAKGLYRIGDFDGEHFEPSGEPQRHYWGNAYAGQTYDNAPDGRRVHFGWMRGDIAAFGGAPFSLQMTLPMDFSLREVDGEVRLWIEPSPEARGLRRRTKDGGAGLRSDGEKIEGFRGRSFEIEAVIDLEKTTAESCGLAVLGESIVWDRATRTLSGAEGRQAVVDGKLRLRVFSDVGTLEVFANGTYVGRYVDQRGGPLTVIANGGEVHFDELRVHRLGSVWNR